MENARDLGIYGEEPFLNKLQRGLTVVLRILFANPLALLLWDIVFVVFMAVIVSREARAHSPSQAFRVTVMVILVVIFTLWGYLLSRYLAPLAERLAFGPPIFRKLGGLQSKTFFTAVKCAHAIKFKFSPEDSAVANEFCRVDQELVQQSLRSKYLATPSAQGVSGTPADFDEIWSRILGIRIKVGPNQFVTYGETLTTNDLGFTMEAPKLQSVSSLVAPLIKLIQMIMVYLLCRFLNGQANLLTVVQVGFFLSLVLSLILFNYHAHQNANIPISFAALEGLTEDLRNRMKALAGRILRPKKIAIKKGYLGLIQDYFSAVLAVVTPINALSTLLLVGIVLLLALVWQPAILSRILPWYKDFSIGLFLVAAGLIATYHLTFLILRNFRLLVAPIAAGVLIVVLPYAFTYLATGRANLNQFRNELIAVFTGLATTLTTTISSRVKKALVGDDEEKKDRKEKEEE